MLARSFCICLSCSASCLGAISRAGSALRPAGRRVGARRRKRHGGTVLVEQSCFLPSPAFHDALIAAEHTPYLSSDVVRDLGVFASTRVHRLRASANNTDRKLAKRQLADVGHQSSASLRFCELMESVRTFKVARHQSDDTMDVTTEASSDYIPRDAGGRDLGVAEPGPRTVRHWRAM